jgi:glycosyltransferase involved in cell wall biosynthesis
MDLTVSIITATYNSARTLAKTIESVILQNYHQIEYIIVDGGSNDGTKILIDKYSKHIDKVISEPDNGIYDAFNKGISHAQGDVIYFLNSDDYLVDSNVLSDIVEYFSADIAAVYGNILEVYDEIENIQILGKELELDDLKRGYMPRHQAFFARKSLYERYGGFDLTYRSSSDFDLITKMMLSEKSTFRYVNRTVAAFRKGGLSSNYLTRLIGMRETEEIIRKRFGCNPILSETEIENNARYRMWFELLILSDRGITSPLKEKGVRKVAIFGTMKTAEYLYFDLKKSNIEVVCFIDNNKNIQGRLIKGIPIVSQDWLVLNDMLDAVVVSIENARDMEICSILKGLVKTSTKVLSWKELFLKDSW